MTEPIVPRDGGCRCGQVRIRISAPPLITSACHCTGCQRMSSSAFSLTATIPTAGFEVLTGSPVVGGLHGSTKHQFCPHCMTWMYTVPHQMDWFINVRSTMIDDRSWSQPFVETFTSEKLPWATTGAVHSFATIPAYEDYDRLTKEYAAYAASQAPR